eukprot:scaffold3627_cov58-Attheya_sp.AAC.1
MGAGNSPAAAGAGGNGFIRSLYERCEAFQGVPRDNTFVSVLQGDPYEPKWSHSRILIGKDCLPAARIWVHVDDFLIHAPTRAKCNLALGAFMDRAVSCGLLCHQRKTKPPAQRQDYVGFTWDSVGTPRLIISDSKKSRALAVIRYLCTLPPDSFLSKKTLAVVTGRLQSLTSATPGNSGCTYLRRLYDVIHKDSDTLRVWT